MLEEAALALEQPEVPCGVRFGTLKKWKKRKDAFLHPPNSLIRKYNHTVQKGKYQRAQWTMPCRTILSDPDRVKDRL